MLFSNVKIGKRLSISFVLLMSILLIISVFSIFGAITLSGLTEKFYQHPFSVSTALLRLNHDIIKMHRSMKDVVLAKDTKQMQTATNTVNNLEKLVYADIAFTQERFLSDPSQISNFKALVIAWKPIRNEVISLIQEGKNEEAANITKGKGANHVATMHAAILELTTFAQNKAETFYNEAQTTKTYILYSSYLFCCLSLLFGIYMMKNMRDQTIKINDNAVTLSTSITEISTAIAEFATSAEETSVTISEVGITVNELRHTAMLVNDKSQHVIDESKDLSKIAITNSSASNEAILGIKKINEEMDYIAESMTNLSEQTQNIGDIVSSVNDLTDQSNLLSVNASIEAAKAGEAGKGFTVVAQEMRSLAEQSREATNQIRTILKDIQKATNTAVMAIERGNKSVEIGIKLSNEVGSSIIAFKTSAGESMSAAEQIGSSSQQQLTGMDQLVAAMDNIKNASLQNVQGSGQLKDATHTLNKVAFELKELSSDLKLAV